MSLAYDSIKAQSELDKHFKPKLTEDRAYRLGLLATGSEEKAYQYVLALSKNKADSYGDSSGG